MKHIKTYYPFYLIFILAVVFFAPVLFQQQFYVFRDIFVMEYGDRKLMSDSYRQGEILLWNPYRMCGMPFLANISRGYLNPFNLLYLFLPYPFSFKIFLLLHLLLCGIGTYCLLRCWDLQKLSSLLGSLCFMLSGQFLGKVENPVYFVTYAWIPAIFCTFHLAIARKSCVYFVITAFLASFQLFSGDPQAFLTTNGLLLPYYLCVKWEKNWWKVLYHGLAIFSIFVILVSALSAIQILPTWELIEQSVRKSDFDYNTSSYWSLTPIQSLQFFCPSLQGYLCEEWYGGLSPKGSFFPFVTSVFLGSVTLFLFWAGIFLPGTRLKYFCLVWVIFFLLLSFGFYLPFFYYIWEYVPLVKKLRFPSKHTIFAALFICLLAAMHFDRLFDQWKELWNKYSKRIFSGLAILGLCYIAIYVFLNLSPEVWNLLPQKHSIKGDDKVINFAPEACGQTIFMFLMFVSLIALWSFLVYKHKTLLGFIFISIIALQMIPEGWKQNPTYSQDHHRRKGWGEKKLEEKNIGFYRYYTLAPLNLIRGFPVQIMAAHVNQTADLGYGSRNGLWEYYQSYGYEAAILERTNYLAAEHNAIFYKFSSTKYIIHPLSAGEKVVYPVLDKKGSILFCENPDCAPRVWCPSQIHFVSNLAQAKEKANVLWKMLEIKDSGIIEMEKAKGNLPDAVEYPSDAKYQAEILRYRNRRVDIDISTDRDRWVILTDTYYPGWTCYIDRQETPIYPANLAFRAFYLPKGRHFVTFVYRSSAFDLGFTISIVSWICCLIFLIGYNLFKLEMRKGNSRSENPIGLEINN